MQLEIAVTHGTGMRCVFDADLVAWAWSCPIPTAGGDILVGSRARAW